MVTSKVVAFAGLAPFFLVSTGCGVIEVAPPKAPDPVMPRGIEMPSKPPEAGKTRVVVDADGERASVNEVTGWSSGHGIAWVGGNSALVTGHAENVKPLCIAPCVVDLDPGVHVLRFADERDRSPMLGAGAAAHKDGLVLGAGVTLGIGATMLLTGIPMAVASQPRVQEGSTTEKTLDR